MTQDHVDAWHEYVMPRSLPHSQFEALEEPGLDERSTIVSIEPKLREIVACILSAMNGAETEEAARASLQSFGAAE